MKANEAREAMKSGKILTHKNFTDGEWMGINSEGRYYFEDGATCSLTSFWEMRPESSWCSGWEVFKGERNAN